MQRQVTSRRSSSSFGVCQSDENAEHMQCAVPTVSTGVFNREGCAVKCAPTSQVCSRGPTCAPCTPPAEVSLRAVKKAASTGHRNVLRNNPATLLEAAATLQQPMLGTTPVNLDSRRRAGCVGSHVQLPSCRAMAARPASRCRPSGLAVVRRVIRSLPPLLLTAAAAITIPAAGPRGSLPVTAALPRICGGLLLLAAAAAAARARPGLPLSRGLRPPLGQQGHRLVEAALHPQTAAARR